MKTSSERRCGAVLAQCPGWGRSAPPYAPAALAAYLRANSAHKVLCLDLNSRVYHASGAKELWDDKDLYSMWEDGPAVSRLITSNRELVEGFVREILETGAPLIGFTVHTTSFLFTLELAKLIKAKAPNKVIILGGPQCSRSQSALKLAAEPCVDAVCTGEGEELLLKVTDSVASGGGIPRLPGLVINLGGGKVLDCGDAPGPADLDSLPFPDYSDFSADMTAGKYADPKRLEILDSRGCPTRCNFCSEWQFWKTYRSMSGARIFAEIERQVKKHPGISHFYFAGSLANGRPSELEDFCDRVIASGLNITWEGQAAVHPAMTALAPKMARSGCTWLGVGIESGSERLLRAMHKPLNLKTALANLRAYAQAGIKVQSNFMFGMPGETRADFDRTLKFLVQARPFLDSVLASQSFCVLDKNTPLYNKAADFGITGREHHLYWSAGRGRNTYPERLKRYEEFCRLALFLGLPETSGVLRKKPDKWLLLGDYYLHAGDKARARTCYRRSLETENFRETSERRLYELGAKPAAAPRGLPPAAERETNLKLNDEEYAGRRTVLESTPRFVTIGAHMACNADCVFCQKDDLPLFSPKIYKDFLEPKIGTFLRRAEKVSFVGFGELLLMPGIEGFLGHINNTLPETWKILTTNGSPLNARVSDLILDGLYSIQVSLHASTPELHRKLTGLKNFSGILKNISRLSRERAARDRPGRLHLSLVSVLNAENAADMPALVRLAAQLGVQELRFEYMTIFRPEHLPLSCWFDKEGTNAVIAAAKDELRRLNVKDLEVRFPPAFSSGAKAAGADCDDPWRHIYVEAQGTVLPCCYWGSHAGDIGKTDIADIWNGPVYRGLRESMASRNPLPDCAHCVRRAGFSVDDMLCHITNRPDSRKAVLAALKKGAVNGRRR
jgi:radical SAM superfamily enzyme YgiQ (UPF0313 family)/sulfatase maturation enzyme AslB (radical SAM superfamily)